MKATGLVRRIARGRAPASCFAALVLSAVPAATAAQEYEAQLLTLERATGIALERNESLRRARQELDKARQQIREARAEALPQIDASADYTHNWRIPSIVFDTPVGVQRFRIGTRNQMTAVLNLRQALYTSGKVGAAREVARLFEDAVAEEVRATDQQVRAAVATSFYDLLLAAEVLAVGTQALERAGADAEQVASLERAGRVTAYDLLRAQVRLGETRADSIRAHTGLHLARMALNDAIGMDLQTTAPVTGSLHRDAGLPVTDLDELVLLAHEWRPDLRQIAAEVSIQRARVRLTRSASRPSVELDTWGQWQWQSDEFDFEQRDRSSSWATGLGVKVPLFDGFRTGAQVRQARHDESRSQLALQQQRRAVELETRAAWLRLDEARARIGVQGAVVEQALESVRLARGRYLGGYGTQLEIIDADLSLTRSRTALAQAERDRSVALVELARAVGRLGESATEGSSDAR